MTPRASNAPKLWPAVPVSLTWIVSSRQAGMAVALGDLARQHRARDAVDVADRRSRSSPAAAFDRGLRLRDQLAVEHVVELVVLRARCGRSPTLRPASGL